MQSLIPLISRFPAFLLLLLCSISTALAQAPSRTAGTPSSQCRFVRLSARAGWLNSGAWLDDGTELVVADARDRKVLSLDPGGRGFVPAPKKLFRGLEGFSPLRLASDSAGKYTFIELDRERFVILDSAGTVLESRKDLTNESTTMKSGRGETVSIDKIDLWAPVGIDILAYAAIKQSLPGHDATWRTDFVKIPSSNPSSFKILTSPSLAVRVFYKLGHPLFTSVGDTAYLLLIGGPPKLFRSRKDSASLEPMGALDKLNINQAPILPSFIRPEDFPAVMLAVERSSMPVGLYSWSNFLYMLSRKPGLGGGTTWLLQKIDPETDRIVSSFEIPTRANHLTVVPGPIEWAFIEKGPVRGFKDQDVNGIIFVPTRRIEKSSGNNLCR